jgi:SAM-dependent methyltransferase
MSEKVDYFSNHSLKLRFPWRLYHGPIVRELVRAVKASPGPDVLNIGSGPFFELKRLPKTDRRFTICDIDERAIDLARRVHGNGLAGSDVIGGGGSLPYADGQFDLVVSMDVIEHVPDPVPWLREATRVLKRGGDLFVTTPNYASWSLRIIEDTILEAVARMQGFSRRHIHPVKLNAPEIRELLGTVGLVGIDVRTVALGWVVAATARKSSAA